MTEINSMKIELTGNELSTILGSLSERRTTLNMCLRNLNSGEKPDEHEIYFKEYQFVDRLWKKLSVLEE